MNVNTEKMKDATPELTKSLINLAEAKIKLNTTDIPFEFSEYYVIPDIEENLLNIIKEVEDIKNWLINKIQELENVEKNNKNIFDRIDDEIYKLGKNFVREFKEIIKTDESTDEFFQRYNNSIYNNSYGVDQGMLNYYYTSMQYNGVGIILKNYNFYRIEKLIQEKYGMSKKDTALLMTCLDSIGACTYAAAANNIIAEFKDSPKEFEKIFGFPMFRKTGAGEKVLNGEELLIDLYVYANSLTKDEQEKLGLNYVDSIFDNGYKFSLKTFKWEHYLKIDKDMVGYDKYGRNSFKKQQYLTYVQRNRTVLP